MQTTSGATDKRVRELARVLVFSAIISHVTDITDIRNFAIIAHIDHGKSTLADRFLELTGTVPKERMRAQMLDSMELERERGITIKSQAVRMDYTANDGHTYQYNLIDTPGHVDFTYEVSRSLASCEGAILLIDASQGFQAQTLANLYMALDADLAIIPVLNKIDLISARPDELTDEVVSLLGCAKEDVYRVSAKSGEGVEAVLETIYKKVPPPTGDPDAPLKGLIFDSHFDSYRGVIVYVRMLDGEIKRGMRIELYFTGAKYEVQEVGVFKPDMRPVDYLRAGEVGYVIATIRNIADARIGDTVIESGRRENVVPAKGFKPMKQMVFCGLYPVESEEYEKLKLALDKLGLNDSSFTYMAETSQALGFGFRCGFLGALHLEIIVERLEREYDLELIITVPNVIYKIYGTDGSVTEIDSPGELPDPTRIEHIEEPYVNATIVTPTDYIGPIMELAHSKRAVQKGMEYLNPQQVALQYEMPLAELIVEFFQRLKTVSRGFGSLDYELSGFKPTKLVRVDILVNKETVDALSFLVDEPGAYRRARDLCLKLRDTIPRHLFEVPIQATIGGKIIARETIRAMRKDVLAKCYGGDITRKRKLLEKQKKGKARMKQVGSVSIPQEAFLVALKVREED